MTDQARALCLYIATLLGDLREEIVVVGGLVPSLLIDQEAPEVEPHVGTSDLDLGLSLNLLKGGLYKEISARLKGGGFKPDQNSRGNRVRHRWVLGGGRGMVDFLISPTSARSRGGDAQNLENDFAAIFLEALPLAFEDACEVVLSGRTSLDEQADRTIRVCGPAAFVALKAHAFHNRGEPKDAYDLVYMLLNFGHDPSAVAERFLAFSQHKAAVSALRHLASDFESSQHTGPMRYASFVGAQDPDLARQDAVGAVQQLLRRLRR